MLTADQISEHGGVTAAYARMILAGTRKPSLVLALRLFDATGVQTGPIADLNPDEIEAARKMADAA